MALVHPTASVSPQAKLADDVEIGAFAVVGPDVELGPGVVVGPQAVVSGRTILGAGTRVYPFAAVGGDPQDQKYAGEPTQLVVGDRNVIREHVTIHVGTVQGGGVTRVGDDNLIMNGVHVAHDCKVGSHTILATYSALAGHVEVGDGAVLGGYTGVHQFCRIGELVMAAANAKVSQDAPPYAMIAGDRARLVGLNSVGLKRAGLSADVQRKIKRAFHLLFKAGLRLEPALERVTEELGDEPRVARLVEFLRASERGVCR